MTIRWILRAVRNGVFRKDISLRAFGRLFYLNNPDIRTNRTARWVRFLRAAREGRLLDRPNTPPLWQPHKIYHTPMWDVLQSSYADVEHEIRVMCGLEPPPPAAPGPFKSSKILFAAGDGLALMRLNHLLHNKSDTYIDMTPMIIPIQGAHLGVNYGSEQSCVCMRGTIHRMELGILVGPIGANSAPSHCWSCPKPYSLPVAQDPLQIAFLYVSDN
jgi:hypothetical protein